MTINITPLCERGFSGQGKNGAVGRALLKKPGSETMTQCDMKNESLVSHNDQKL